ncbi:E3 ubiquitin-protein ligase RING1-like [Mercurialis annua]|uniref:E3 ubiquitin-protein ligase RING1-like n=1 Tax=Mercurialis annua TaxID=3986 RepID=UPI002160B4DC|nr:E3 ubiquitin-protein ligase RING1-like [Mercurialis annua]
MLHATDNFSGTHDVILFIHFIELEHLIKYELQSRLAKFSKGSNAARFRNTEIINLHDLAVRLRASSLGDDDVYVYDEVGEEEEPPTSGVSTSVLMKLKAESFTAAESGGSDCAICLEDFGGDEKKVVIKMPNCGHSFHENCIFRWLQKKKSCPMCRRQVED